MECLWYVFAGFMIGGMAGMLVTSLMVMARDSGGRYPTLPADSVHPFEATHPLY